MSGASRRIDHLKIYWIYPAHGIIILLSGTTVTKFS